MQDGFKKRGGCDEGVFHYRNGKRIAEEEIAGVGRADYGKQTIKQLSDELTDEYGKGFDQSSLYKFVRFYREFPNILDSASPKSRPLLSWTHYRVLLQVDGRYCRQGRICWRR